MTDQYKDVLNRKNMQYDNYINKVWKCTIKKFKNSKVVAVISGKHSTLAQCWNNVADSS